MRLLYTRIRTPHYVSCLSTGTVPHSTWIIRAMCVPCREKTMRSRQTYIRGLQIGQVINTTFNSSLTTVLQ